MVGSWTAPISLPRHGMQGWPSSLDSRLDRRSDPCTTKQSFANNSFGCRIIPASFLESVFPFQSSLEEKLRRTTCFSAGASRIDASLAGCKEGGHNAVSKNASHTDTDQATVIQLVIPGKSSFRLGVPALPFASFSFLASVHLWHNILTTSK